MSIYIQRYKTISVLDSFEDGVSNHLPNSTKTLIEPNYKELIPANLLRRMSNVLKMGVGCAVKTAGDESLDGIIVASGIGCFNNSIAFTKNYKQKLSGALSPTPFIQSTDNAIAGQIAIVLKNHGYNNTYIHKGIAFENALLDATMLLNEGEEKVLVGGVDEWIKTFEYTGAANEWIGEGASFFVLSSEKENAKAEIQNTWVLNSSPQTIEKDIETYLKEKNLNKPQLILAGNSYIDQDRIDLSAICDETFFYSDHCGIYFTNSAFAMQLAAEIVEGNHDQSPWGKDKTEILIVNNFNDEMFGVTYISRVKE